MAARAWARALGAVMILVNSAVCTPTSPGRCTPPSHCDETPRSVPDRSRSPSPQASEPQPLVAGLASRDRRDPASFIDSWNPRASWAELQPNGEGTPIVHPNAIDVSLAEARTAGQRVRIRLDTGYRSPAWLKAMVGTVSICDPPGGGSPTSLGCFDVPRWWTDGWRSAHDAFIRVLAAEYDGDVALFHACTVATLHCEPFLKQVGGHSAQARDNRRHLEAKGFSTAGDRASWYAAIDSWGRNLASSRVAISLNPGQGFSPATNTWRVNDLSYTRDITDRFVAVLGARAVVQNNGLNEHRASGGHYARLYAYMRTLRRAGTPIAFQTSVGRYIPDLASVVQLAISYGAHLVELPERWEDSDISAEEWLTYRGRLLAQA